MWLEQDEEDEPNEYFAVEAFLPGNFLVPDAVGTMTIVDDEPYTTSQLGSPI